MNRPSRAILLLSCTLTTACVSHAWGAEPVDPAELYQLIGDDPSLFSDETASSLAATINASPMAQGYINMRLHGPPVKAHRAVPHFKKHPEIFGAHHYCMQTVEQAEVLACISATSQAVQDLIEAAYIRPSQCFQGFGMGDPDAAEALIESKMFDEALKDCPLMSNRVSQALSKSGHAHLRSAIQIKGIDGMAGSWDYYEAMIDSRPAQQLRASYRRTLESIEEDVNTWLYALLDRFDASRINACMEPVPDMAYSDVSWQPNKDHEPALEKIRALSSQQTACRASENLDAENWNQAACEDARKNEMEGYHQRYPNSTTYQFVTPMDIQLICARVVEQADPLQALEEKAGHTAADIQAQQDRLQSELSRANSLLQEALAQQSDCRSSCRQIVMDDCCLFNTGNTDCFNIWMEEYTHSTGNIAYREVSGIDGDWLKLCGEAADENCQYCD